ncbi:MAG TPA: hypothetical protein VEU08_18955 [Vicinamibacterales bacterium]|nr:hypothetical protein [Vicinamibacterales bacterium]
MTGRASILVSALVLSVAAASTASAQNLVDLLPTLLKQGAVIAPPATILIPTRVDTSKTDLSQSFVPSVTLTTVPQILNAALALQLSTGTLGPMAGTVIYSRDGNGPEMHQTFGGGYADRGRTMGKGHVGLSMTFQNDEYPTLDGIDLNGGGINFLFANVGPSPDTSDVLQETVSYRINRKTTSFLFNWGALDRLDLKAVIPIVQVAMDVRVQSRILRVRTPLDVLASCAPGAVPARNAGDGIPLRLCQDPHGYDQVLTLATSDTYLDQSSSIFITSNNYGVSGKTARGVGDIQLGAKYAVVQNASTALAATVNLSVPSGNTDNFLGNGARRVTPGIAWSASVGRVSPHINIGYTKSSGNLSSTLLTNTPVAPDLKVPDEINWAAGFDAAVFKRTTLVTDFFGRTQRNVQRFTTGKTAFASDQPNYPADVAAATDLIPGTRGDVQQSYGTIGGRVNIYGPIFANGTVIVPIRVDGLKPKPGASFWIDYAF